jgi:deoxyribonuclease-4
MEQRSYHIGTHIGRNGSLPKSLKTFYEQSGLIESLKEDRFKIPIQIFSGNPKSFGVPVVSDDVKKECLEYITKNNIQAFFHAPYIINLARPAYELALPLKRLSSELELGYAIGIKGVVVHVGKSLKMPIEEAIKNMRENVILMLKYATKECQLLIETPAGQGSEMLTDIKDFAKFYNDFSDKEKEKLGTCVDTCHVFSLGYDPYRYLKTLKKEYNIPVNLLHYNDSKEELGSKKDRHEVVGCGKIPIEQLKRCSKRAIKKGIPIVTEY